LLGHLFVVACYKVYGLGITATLFNSEEEVVAKIHIVFTLENNLSMVVMMCVINWIDCKTSPFVPNIAVQFPFNGKPISLFNGFEVFKGVELFDCYHRCLLLCLLNEYSLPDQLMEVKRKSLLFLTDF